MKFLNLRDNLIYNNNNNKKLKLNYLTLY